MKRTKKQKKEDRRYLQALKLQALGKLYSHRLQAVLDRRS